LSRRRKSHLVNQFETGLDYFKLLPTQTNGDRSAYLEVIKGEVIANATSRVGKAYQWFYKKLNSRGCPEYEKLAGVILRRLSLVSIVLDHDDNPHLIFESLNYKGEPLTQGDLKQEVKTWRSVLKVTLEAVRDAGPDDFEGVIAQFPRLFSSKPEVFNAPRLLSDGGTYFESNLNATSVTRYCQQIVEAAGYAPIEWFVETA
jgi:hypothetical protein